MIEIDRNCTWIRDKSIFSILKSVVLTINQKMETLALKSKGQNENAKGTIYSVRYYDGKKLEFRKHDSKIKNKGRFVRNRFSIKPYYRKGTHDSLPVCPVIYLGLSRLLTYGEFCDDSAIKLNRGKVPKNFLENLSKSMAEFTRLSISEIKSSKVGDVKIRGDFSTDVEGIDSNTISSGEDNLFVILSSLEALRYYFESIDSKNDVESILLIDEVDATLHPALQIKLLEKFREYSQKYKIQIIFTSHSMTVVEDITRHHDSIIYLVDEITSVYAMDNPTSYAIEAHLRELLGTQIYKDKRIMVFTEDDEARWILERILRYFQKEKQFDRLHDIFYIPNFHIGASVLEQIFREKKMFSTTNGAICVLDGDQKDKANNENAVICLPGCNSMTGKKDLSPEKLLFDFAEYLYENDREFWRNNALLDVGITKPKYRECIKDHLDKYYTASRDSDTEKNAEDDSERKFLKNLYKNNALSKENFFDFVFERWLNDEKNREELDRFYVSLKNAFMKVCAFNGISRDFWKKD